MGQARGGRRQRRGRPGAARHSPAEEASGSAALAGGGGPSIGFASYTAFCYLMASMGLQALWSLGLACLDGYALKAKKDLTNPVLLSLFVVGDTVTSILSYAASCSAGGVVVLFKRDVLFCRRYPQLPCGRYELATALAFMSWSFSAASALIMFWLLAAT